MNNSAFVCALCGGRDYHARLTLADRIAGTTDQVFYLVKCSVCGLLRLLPQPDEETLARAYPEDYAPFARPGLSACAKRVLERRTVQRLWDYLRPPRRILDIGCAAGDLLAAILEQGNREVVGIEPDARAVQFARHRGLNVHEGYLETVDLKPGIWSTVLLEHVIEHVHDPLNTLKRINELLIPGGAVLLWTPNADSLAARRLGRYWMGYDAPRHLTTFSKRTLALSLRAAGFRVVKIEHEATGLEWAWGLRLYLRERLPLLNRLLQRLHVLAIIACTPLGVYSAITRQSGRILVVAIKEQPV